MVIMKIQFESLLQELGISLSEKQWHQFHRYYELLVEWNQKINLTALTEIEDVFIKHFYDSLCLLKGIEIKDQTLLDVGSGAGFPSIPLKIIFPELDVTIIDALSKRIKFLEVLTKELDVEARLIHGRAEEFERKHCYDIVTARAVANLRVLSELCIPFVKVDGYFIALKGPKHDIELDESMNAITTLGGKHIKTLEYEVQGQTRSLLLIKKVTKSLKIYPRAFAKIKKNPL